MPEPKEDRYEIRNPEIEETMREIGGRTGSQLPAGWGFALFLFEYNDDALFYISSAEREDVSRMLQEWLKRRGGS